ncbi:TetR/AcrR family transcriptional regulator [Spirillospora sp. CA-294931]|uniref:TetR/AcrR family transcriptional regulator n=1 Tax=Spirillospora sp. CA-294931 TaxID=3240042 RepID=UPI003D909FF2
MVRRAKVGRPRDPERGRAVLAATLRLLAESGYHALRVDAVAEGAGVAKTTIYRRWPSKQEMVMDALSMRLGETRLQDTDDPVADLRRLTAVVYGQLAEDGADRTFPLLLAELLQFDELATVYRARFVEPARSRARYLIRRAVDRGQIRAEIDPEVLMDAVISPVLYRPLAIGGTAGPEFGLAVLDLVMTGARPRA